MSVCTSVRPSTKSFFDFNETWCVKALSIIAAVVAAAFAAKWDHSIANNVMGQKGSFSMPGKCK